MGWKTIESLLTVFGIRSSQLTTVNSEHDGDLSTVLYWCPDCELTYISEEMNTCASCDASVETVPTERDLGY